MGSITQSPDRIAQVLSGSAIQGAGDSALNQGAADSNPAQVVEQAVTGVSAAEFVYESRQQHSSVSEGVASAGNPPQVAVDRMDEFVPAAAFDLPVSAAVGCEGETSGGGDVGDGSNGYGDLADTAGVMRAPPPLFGSPMDFHATTASALNGPSHASGKRKSCGEASGDFLEPKRPEGGEGLNRVPSDLAMVMGLSDGEGAEPVEARLRQQHLEVPCDSNMAGILAGLGAAPAAANDVEIGQAPDAADGTTGFGAAPTDADIIAWENQIKEDEVRNVPLVGDMEPLSALEAEYRSGSHVFMAKIQTLHHGYTSIRRTRGDGNCFFRSFLFAYLEHILLSRDFVERDAAVGRLTAIRQSLIDAGYEDLVVESPLEMLLSMLRSIGSPTDPLTMEALEGNMRSEDISNYVVFLLRMVTSAEVKRRADFFAPFVMGLTDLDVDTFCKRCIDPMGEESDHVQMVALTDALQVPLRVIYLDRSMGGVGSDGGGGTGAGDYGGGGGGGGGAGGSYDAGAASVVAGESTICTVASAAPSFVPGIKVDIHDFVPDGFEGSPEPKVHLLYRPGHYDVLYPRVG